MKTAIGFLLSTVFGCARSQPVQTPVPLTANEAPLLGCYTLIVGPWAAVSDSTSRFDLQLDSFGSVAGREMILLSWPKHPYRASYWTATAPSAFRARFVWGVEGQGFEFQLRLIGDSVVGTAAEHTWPTEPPRLAPARGVRAQCPKGPG